MFAYILRVLRELFASRFAQSIYFLPNFTRFQQKKMQKNNRPSASFVSIHNYTQFIFNQILL